MDDTIPRSASFNMAADEILLQRTSQPALRLYRWANAAVSFGYFGRLDEVRTRWPGRELVRRWTGGGEVEHRGEVTYALAIPKAADAARWTASESYRRIHAALLPLLGADVALAQKRSAPPGGACFQNPVADDVMRGAEKIAGAAQRRCRFGVLHQGSIITPDADSLRAALPAAFAENFTHIDWPTEWEAEVEQLALEKYASEAWLGRW